MWNGVSGVNRRERGVSLWVCHQCSYSTRHRGHLNQHMAVHSGRRPFGCHLCPMAFSRRATLANHLQLHQRQSSSSFQCRLCPLAFTLKSTLAQHINSHLAGAPADAPAAASS